MNKQLQNLLVFVVVGTSAYMIFGRNKQAVKKNTVSMSPYPMVGGSGGNLRGSSRVDEENEVADTGYSLDGGVVGKALSQEYPHNTGVVSPLISSPTIRKLVKPV